MVFFKVSLFARKLGFLSFFLCDCRIEVPSKEGSFLFPIITSLLLGLMVFFFWGVGGWGLETVCEFYFCVVFLSFRHPSLLFSILSPYSFTCASSKNFLFSFSFSFNPYFAHTKRQKLSLSLSLSLCRFLILDCIFALGL